MAGRLAKSCKRRCSRRPKDGLERETSVTRFRCEDTHACGRFGDKHGTELPWEEHNMILMLEWFGSNGPLEPFDGKLSRNLALVVVGHALLLMRRYSTAP